MTETKETNSKYEIYFYLLLQYARKYCLLLLVIIQISLSIYSHTATPIYSLQKSYNNYFNVFLKLASETPGQCDWEKSAHNLKLRRVF